MIWYWEHDHFAGRVPYPSFPQRLCLVGKVWPLRDGGFRLESAGDATRRIFPVVGYAETQTSAQLTVEALQKDW